MFQFLINWSLYHYIITFIAANICSQICFVYDYTPAFFRLLLIWYILSHPFTHNLLVSIFDVYFFYTTYIVGSSFFSSAWKFSAFLLTLYVISTIVRFESTLSSCFLFYLFFVLFFLFLPNLRLNKCSYKILF